MYMKAYLKIVFFLSLMLLFSTDIFSQCQPHIIGKNKFCPGLSTTLQVENNFDTYQWSTNSTSNTTEVSQAGWVYVTVTQGTCTGKDSIQILAADAVSADITASETTACKGEQITLTASGAGAGGSYVWGDGLGGNQILNVTVNESKKYTLIAVSADDCFAQGSIQITAVDTPDLILVPISKTICRGGSVNLLGIGAESYTWFPDYQLSATTGAQVTATPEYTTEYTLIGSNSLNGKVCSASKKSIITVDNYSIDLPLPKTVCKGKSETIIATQQNGTPPYTYSWYINGQLESNNSLAFNTEIDGNTEVNLVAVDANNCSDSKTTTYKNYPPLILNAFVNKDSVCSGDPVLFNASISGGTGAPYQFLLDGKYSNMILTIFPKQTHEYLLQAKDGCGVTSKKLTLYTHPIPNIDFSVSSDTICANTEVQFKSLITPKNTVKGYKWSFGDNGRFSGLKDPAYKYTKSGLFDVNLQITTNEGCIADTIKEKMIRVNPIPEVAFSANKYEASILSSEIIFTNKSPKLDSLNYIWNFGEGASSLEKHPDYRYINPGVYTVTLQGINRYSCSAIDSTIIKIKPVVTLYMPTAFTPNGDIHNRVFTPRGTGISTEDYEFIVYDRYGFEVFSTNKLSEGWNGNYNNGDKPAKQGTYVYFVRYKNNITNEFQEKKGQFMLFR